MLRIFPKKRKWYLREPDNVIDRRLYKYYEVYKRIFWRIYKYVGAIPMDDIEGNFNVVYSILTRKFSMN